ncbi:recombination protein subunit [Serratia phage phiMAM1]|uniref:Recombination protein subunit n=2 Tax=Miltonvirus MAM1 TaxID=2169689 RepID=K7YB59_9CAUD|nr:recombination protein subunit [Serratia phage phiMAM1]AFX93577.1 recombination protein subunit [Serratia phage phiMAM1]ASZ78885.1 recombination protein subunit [Serratia phage 2050H1]
MSIAKIGDLHIGARQGSKHVREFIKDYIINYFLPEIDMVDIKEIFQFGDMFDVRKHLYGRDRYWLTKELVPELRRRKMVWHTIVGNHDISMEESNHVNWPALLEDIAPDVFRVYSEPTEIVLDGVKVLAMPWINKENYARCVKAIEDTDAKVMYAHLELAGFKMYQSSTCDHGQIDLSLLAKFDKVETGHFHTRSADKNVEYLGSPYHLTWEDYKDGCNRGFYVEDLDKPGSNMFIPNDPERTLFRVINYDYSKIPADQIDDWKSTEWLNDGLGLRGQIVRVVVTNRDNVKHYEAFTDAMKRCQCVDYNYSDMTVTISTEKIEVTEEMIATDAVEVLKTDIRAAENIQRKDSVCKLAERYFSAAQQRLALDI